MVIRRKIKAADLFCGAGGTSTGLRLACEALGIDLDLAAINHCPDAIATHLKNHPEAVHLCTNLDNVDPLAVVPGGYLDILVASPECTHHSVARGGKPINDQSRASAWRVVEWASKIRIKTILIENVKEFRGWGGLGANGRPLKRKKGETYFAFLNALRSLGYTVEDQVLNAADYDNPTSRERLFIIATLGRKPIKWPEPTHGPAPKVTSKNGTLFDLRPNLKPHRPAREIIDWSIPSESIYTRKRPLRPNTMARIYAGLQKFCGLPFIVPQMSGGANRGLDRPVPTIVTTSRGIGLCEPFIVVLRNNVQPTSIHQSLKAICANGLHHGLCEPFIVELTKGKTARSVNDSLSTIRTKGAHHALCEPQPFLIRYNGNHDGKQDGENRNQSLNRPLGTLDTANRYGLVQPFLINAGGPEVAPRSTDEPMNTILTRDHMGLVEPFIIGAGGPSGAGNPQSVNAPLNAVLTENHKALIEPFLTKYNGTGGAKGLKEPLDAATTRDRFGLVEPELQEWEGLAILDIKFRMLQPKELAAAMSFPKSYHFTGNREKIVRQIGNAVPVNLAKALCQTILTDIL